jgi:uncharacterized protein YjbI with pentapeptide repeats
MLGLASVGTTAHADIYQWEYINPADPSQGKRQSTTLAPDGAGVDALPGADLSNRNLTMAYLIGADLTDARGYLVNLTDADLRHANITDAVFAGADLTGANFDASNLANTSFNEFQCGDTLCIPTSATLTNVGFANANLRNVLFTATWLTNASFSNAEIRGANFGKYVANICGAMAYCPIQFGTGITPGQLSSTASFQTGDLSGIDFSYNNLAEVDLANQILTDTNFSGATLTDANLTGADVRDANFDTLYRGFASGNDVFGTGITLDQLYSTASYQARDLRGIGLSGNVDLAGANLAGQNLTNAEFAFVNWTSLDFTGADTRGAYFFNHGGQYNSPVGAITTNLIQAYGHIDALDLNAGDLLAVRDYDGMNYFEVELPPIPIDVDQHFTMTPGGTLRMVFEADAWDSTISFAPGIPVTRGGTLELTFAADVDLATQLGRTLDLFNWTGVSPTGDFAVVSPYHWDTSKLYTIGEVTLVGLPEPRPLVLVGVCVVAIVSMRRSRPSTIGRVIQGATRLFPLVAYACAVRPDILSWHSRAIHEVLRDEAEALIGRGREKRTLP